MPEPISSYGWRHTEKIGVVILPTHVYCNEEKVMVWITLGFSSF
jgi:hypothetical protein